MKQKSKSLAVGGVTCALTAVLTIFRDFENGYAEIVWAAWVFHGWNCFAYAFDRDMWPWVFAELYGRGKGKPGVREFYFWGTAVMYLSFLAVLAFAN